MTGLPLEELEANAARDGTPVDPFARALMEGVASDTASLDELITGAAEGWTADRLAPLERNILRVAVHELLDWPDIPAAVSINEAVDLAKRYCQTEAAGPGQRHPRAASPPSTRRSRDRRRRGRASRPPPTAWSRSPTGSATRTSRPDELRALADEALALGAEITERLPRVLRDS